ncbi:MAG: PfkB family carbohydrate kinase, partial [bacterium]|nr:PfkB family carbohydrate kinase [bacterium]
MITPRITGTGLFTLDAVPIPGSPQYRLFAGGSSINVLTILATEGWDAYPVGCIGRDRASAYFMQDLSRFGLNLDFILQKTESAMPVYVQISHAESHQFVRQCPACGAEFSHYDAISEAEAEAITAALPGPFDWVYLERVAPGALHFAKRCKAKGARLYFEPNRIDNEALFLECLRFADVFKYSHERYEMMEHRSGSIP